jgi:hypothetical protein
MDSFENLRIQYNANRELLAFGPDYTYFQIAKEQRLEKLLDRMKTKDLPVMNNDPWTRGVLTNPELLEERRLLFEQWSSDQKDENNA